MNACLDFQVRGSLPNAEQRDLHELCFVSAFSVIQSVFLNSSLAADQNVKMENTVF